MKSITVFTPTFNREKTLVRLYNSLCSQTSPDFKWIIIDDGSTDNTSAQVEKWIEENKIEIQYYYQKNKGKLAAQILALDYIDTELFTCIDSDDYLPDDGIRKILKFWKDNRKSNSAGIIGLDAYEDGSVAGECLPNVEESTYSELVDYYKTKGDKKYIFDTAKYKKYLPYPYFENEIFHEVSWIFTLIDQDYKFLISNEIYCIIEYQQDGLSNGLYKRYKSSPKSFIEYRKMKMKYGINKKVVLKNSVHYVSSCLFAGKWNFFKDSPNKLYTLMAIPFGILLNVYINYKIKQSTQRIKQGKLK
ncbi:MULTISPECIES: glycosyltransferase family 2 protein [Chryseobacterium]|uniref:Glycosyltransferase involved in cell wall biosynthesis n=1 Tax=Chryseobacterium geocarposphaerae TaxID=1416776 RepID=A0ABU1L940_9FLAO|nr:MULTISPECIES: glycosyltransferase family 2 protein [Chryseobacterium]MDR6403234.1 glycosyltransferase involved in cell wall biosynthesis [Chryseobacterium geocarposphaerae]MDR6696788.1 glycosyltransferase involved in cell wall biosynthesis [Chryseobacterium ginsenosidimutans]